MLANSEQTYSDADAEYYAPCSIYTYERAWANRRLAQIRLNPEKWNWSFLSMNSNFNLEDILENRDLPWDWVSVCKNPNITADDVFNNMDIPWDWDIVCLMPSLREYHIIENPSLPWNYHLISSNQNICAEFLIDVVYVGTPAEETLEDEDEDAPDDGDEEEPTDDDDDDKNAYNYYLLCRSYGSSSDFCYYDEDTGRPVFSDNKCYYQDQNNRPIKYYNWEEFSRNPSLYIELVMNNTALPWCWEQVIANKSISLDDIINNLYDAYNKPTDLHYFWESISDKVRDIHYPLTHMTNARGKPYRWDWGTISYNSYKIPSLTVDVLVQHKDLPWNWDELSKNKNITADDILRTLHHNLPWNWETISRSKEFTLDQIHACHDLINWDALSKNSHITQEMIQSTPHLNWTALGRIRAMPTLQIMEVLMEMKQRAVDNPREPLENMAIRIRIDNEIQSREDINLELITANPTYPWRWYNLSNTLSLDEILSAPHLNWGWASISTRQELSIDFVLGNPQYPWNFTYISEHPSLTLEHIRDHPEVQWAYGKATSPFDMHHGGLSENEMVKARNAFIKTQIRIKQELMTLQSIQRQTAIHPDLINLISGYLCVTVQI